MVVERMAGSPRVHPMSPVFTAFLRDAPVHPTAWRAGARTQPARTTIERGGITQTGPDAMGR